MKLNNPYQNKKFFNTKNKWIEIVPPEKKNMEIKRDAETCKSDSRQTKSKNEIYRKCIEYWDDIKEKYKYNHLYRKRVLQVEQQNLEETVDNKNELNNLLISKGQMFSQYANKSKDIGFRGQGVWKYLNGEDNDICKDKDAKPQESVQSSLDQKKVIKDLMDDLKKCLFDESSSPRSESLLRVTSPDSLETNIVNRCEHIINKKHKKLFNIPQCLEEDTKEEELPLIAPTAFEWCMKELHDLKEPVKSDNTSKDSKISEDPWCRLERCQREKYGFSGTAPCQKMKEIVVERQDLEEDFYDKIINNIMEREVRVAGAKMKIKEVLDVESPEEINHLAKCIDITAKGKDQVFLGGSDLRREEQGDEEKETIKNVLDTLVGEWTAMGIFLRELAENSTALAPKRIMSFPKKSLEKRPLGPLGKNVNKMIEDMIKNDQNGLEDRDLSVGIKYELFHSKCHPHPYKLSCSHCNKEYVEKSIGVNYREKTDFKIKWDKKGEKLLSKQSAIKKAFTVGSYEDTKEYVSFVDHTIDWDECPCYKTNKSTENENKTPKTYHRGLVKLISDGKYAGSWDRLGMEGCGKYISPGGTIIDGNMSDGVFNGPAIVYLPNGIIVAGVFENGRFHSPKITFGDGVEYKNKDWEYLKTTKKLSKNGIRLYRPILDREIPNGCYDAGEGFYNPTTKQIHHPVTLEPLRSVSEREEKWIVSICRAAESKCVSLDEHLYEMIDIPLVRPVLDEEIPMHEGVWKDCRSPYYHLPQIDDEPSEQRTSPDRLIEIDEKSRPVDELWDSLKQLTGVQRAKVSVPFSYEKTVHYTCYDHLIKQPESN